MDFCQTRLQTTSAVICIRLGDLVSDAECDFAHRKMRLRHSAKQLGKDMQQQLKKRFGPN